MLTPVLLVSWLVAVLGTVTGWAGQQPQLAHEGARVFLVSAQGPRVQVRRSADEGRSFVEATPIVPNGIMAAGMRRGPRVAVTRDAVLVAAVVGARGGGADGDVVLYRSDDDAASWSAGEAINDLPGSAREGLHGLAATAEGVVVVSWLDLREKGTRVQAAVSRDHGRTWSADLLVYASPEGSVCECCHPSVAVEPSGEIAVMFRNQLGGARDLYVSRSRDGRSFGDAVKQGTGQWQLAACPMDGGALAISGGRVVSVWRREDGVFVSSSLQPERQVGIGRDPVAATHGGLLDLAWSTADGITVQRGIQTRLLGPGRFPSMLAFATHTLLTWEHQGQVQVQDVPR